MGVARYELGKDWVTNRVDPHELSTRMGYTKGVYGWGTRMGYKHTLHVHISEIYHLYYHNTHLSLTKSGADILLFICKFFSCPYHFRLLLNLPKRNWIRYLHKCSLIASISYENYAAINFKTKFARECYVTVWWLLIEDGSCRTCNLFPLYQSFSSEGVSAFFFRITSWYNAFIVIYPAVSKFVPGIVKIQGKKQVPREYVLEVN